MTAADLRVDASRRHVMRRAATVGLLMRNSVALIVALVALADPASRVVGPALCLLVGVAAWSAYRVATRSHHAACTVIDYGWVILVCLAIPLLAPDPQFYVTNSAPQAIAGTAVVSFAVSVPLAVSLPMTAGIAVAYAWGAAGVVSWDNVTRVAAVYYFALQWCTAGLIRSMVLRVADAVDAASAGRRSAELEREVNEAVRGYEREQLALLHDTAASTLLIVGQGGAPSPERLTAQARRDLDLLTDGPWEPPPPQIELVEHLRDCVTHIVTPVRFGGLPRVWVPGDAGKRVVAAAREVLNNVDRHARADLVRITVGPRSVRFDDNGIGFDPAQPRTGHGINDSIVERMRRAGGTATITSAPGAGTTTELSWAHEDRDPTPSPTDTDRFIERVRMRFGLALVVYALANLAVSVPQAGLGGTARHANAALAVFAALAVLAAVPGILHSRWTLVKPAAVGLAVVTIAQPLLLPPELVGGYAHWAQSSIGWCVAPLLLAVPTWRGVAVLTTYWVLGAIVEFACNPQSAILVNIGLGTASILSVQVFALLFNGLVRDAAAEAQAETDLQQRLIARERVSAALRDEYQRRYARLVDNVVDLLKDLSESGAVRAELQRRARIESRRLRALFDQAATFEHPLMQSVRRIVDNAEARGVDVVIDVAGDLPPLDARQIDSLLAPLRGVAAGARTTARLVVAGAPEEVSVSLVCDGAEADTAQSCESGRNVSVDVVTTADTVWVEVRHTLTDASTPRLAYA